MRGIGASLLILEEAAYIASAIIQSVLAPILSVLNTAVVAISTLGEQPTDVFMRMLKSNFFYVHEVSFICKPCQDRGVTDVCIHNRDFLPPWGGANKELIAVIMDGNEGTHQRENLGVNNGTCHTCYTVASVDHLFSRPRTNISDVVNFVYIAIDPVTGSDDESRRSSDFSVVSICSPYTTILSVDAISVTRTEHFEEKLKDCLNNIRGMPMMASCVFVVNVEAGTGLSAPDIETTLSRSFEGIVFMTDFAGKAGTLTSESNKVTMMELTQRHLDMKEVSFFSKLVTSHAKPKDMLLEFKAQLHAFKPLVTPAKGTRSAPSVKLTGKENGKRDDMCMTFMRAIYTRHMFLTMAKYRKYLI